MELLKCVLLLVSVLSVCEAAALPSCTWIHHRLKSLSEKTNGLLESMGGPMPLECLEVRQLSFPDDVFLKAQNEDLVSVALETLRGVSTIFKNDKTSVTWDNKKLRLFRNIMNTQVEKLQECFQAEKEVQTATDEPADSSAAALRSYFEKLEERLKEKGFSSCGWETVRAELQDGLEKFLTFLQDRT